MLRDGLRGQSEPRQHLKPFGDGAGARLPAPPRGWRAANTPGEGERDPQLLLLLPFCSLPAELHCRQINICIHQALPIVFLNSLLTGEEEPDFSTHNHTDLDKTGPATE